MQVLRYCVKCRGRDDYFSTSPVVRRVDVRAEVGAPRESIGKLLKLSYGSACLFG